MKILRIEIYFELHIFRYLKNSPMKSKVTSNNITNNLTLLIMYDVSDLDIKIQYNLVY